MRIALIGYGKMGHMIEEVALERGHTIVLRITRANLVDFNRENIAGTDVAIEFTGPDSAMKNVASCLEYGIPVVSGSTGWNKSLEEARRLCSEKNGSFLHASNFSIGVNIFFELNQLLARLMSRRSDYDVSMKEIHHTAKKDAPSGTAVTLAEQVLSEMSRKTAWVSGPAKSPADISIISNRVDPAPGTHHVKYSSEIDDIEIVHTAHNRKGFALGAVMAAEHIWDKKGIFSMKDVLDIRH